MLPARKAGARWVGGPPCAHQHVQEEQRVAADVQRQVRHGAVGGGGGGLGVGRMGTWGFTARRKGKGIQGRARGQRCCSLTPRPSPAHVRHDHGHEGPHGVRPQQRQHALMQQAAQGGAHAGVAVHHALRQRGQHLGFVGRGGMEV